MPAQNVFCGCFGGRGPPEITHSVDMGHQLQPMAINVPMPQDLAELDRLFEGLVVELDLDQPHRDALFSLPAEKKWQIYCSQKQDDNASSNTVLPEYYVDRLRRQTGRNIPMTPEETNQCLQLVDSLKTALRTQAMSFVTRFLQVDGLELLLDALRKMDLEKSTSGFHTSIIGCFKALMNNSQGRASVLSHTTSLQTIAQSLQTENNKARIAVLEILGAVCLVPGGHRQVLAAMLHFQKYAAERTRFQTLIYNLDRPLKDYQEEVGLKTAIMSFFNALLKYGPGEENLEFRIHLRYELLMLGIQPIIDKLRTLDNITLNTHLDFFEMVRCEDERELAKRFNDTHVDSKSASAMFELIRKKLSLTPAYIHFLSIFYHLIMLPYGADTMMLGYWLLIDRVVQQIAIQKNGEDSDFATLELNVRQAVRRLTSEGDIKAFQQKLREVEKIRDEFSAKLDKMEKEFEAKEVEKEELVSIIDKLKSRLDREQSEHEETKAYSERLTANFTQLEAQLLAEQAEREKIQYMLKSGSLPDDAKVEISFGSSHLTNGIASLPGLKPVASLLMPPGMPPPPPPAPPPPPGMGPPPPPLIMGGKTGSNGTNGLKSQRKKGPTSSQPLKSFNWSKLPEVKVSGTIWSDLDDTKLYSQLDLEDFEKMFSAYQKKQADDEMENRHSKIRTKELSVIDGRRAQNCTILLSKLKLKNEDLRSAILTMDEHDDLPKDMLEQLLKYVPSGEESQLLQEHEREMEQMARADRFLYEMSRIIHYEQRLKALYFKKRFSERMDDCKQKLTVVLKASNQVIRSSRLKTLLELVLAFGNYMNRGQRGNAIGFKLDSLNKIIDTKSSLSKNITLLHYIIQILEKQFPDVLKLDKELDLSKEASKVNLPDLEGEIASVRAGLADLDKEIQFFQTNTTERRDKFVPVITSFLTVASYKFSEIEDLHSDMKKKFESALNKFGEDLKVTQPEVFFGIFDSFLASFSEAKLSLDKIRQQKELADKRALQEERAAKEAIKSRNYSGGVSKGNVHKKGKTDKTSEFGEFDDLISALRTGEVFGKDIAKMRNRRRAQPQEDNIRERYGK